MGLLGKKVYKKRYAVLHDSILYLFQDDVSTSSSGNMFVLHQITIQQVSVDAFFSPYKGIWNTDLLKLVKLVGVEVMKPGCLSYYELFVISTS